MRACDALPAPFFLFGSATDTHSVPLWSLCRDKAPYAKNLTLKLLHGDYGQLGKTQITNNYLRFSTNALKKGSENPHVEMEN